MHCKTLRIGLWIVLGIHFLGMMASAKTAAPDTARVTISVFNDAFVSQKALRGAEDVASRVFASADVQIEWMNCGRASETAEEQQACAATAFPEHLHIRIIQRSLMQNAPTLGLSYLDKDGSGCQAEVFYQAVAEVVAQSEVNVATILGNAMAHEVGHLLLGTNSHSAEGIMRAHWNPPDLAAASKGLLVFSERQKDEIRTKLDSKLLYGDKTRSASQAK
jgi:hypothetical protein